MGGHLFEASGPRISPDFIRQPKPALFPKWKNHLLPPDFGRTPHNARVLVVPVAREILDPGLRAV
jgi:hypothetical protein